MSQEHQSLGHRFSKSYVHLTYKSPWISLALFLIFTGVMAMFASKLHISTDLRLLLPENTPSVHALETSEKRLGSTDYFVLAFEDSSAARVGQFQKALAESLKTWKPVKWTQYDQDQSFFRSHALLYMPADQLQDLSNRLKTMSKGAAAYNPLAIDLTGNEPAAPANLDGWPDKKALYKQGIPMDIVESLLHKINQESSNKGNAVNLTDSAGDPVLPDSLSDRMIGWHGEKHVWVGVVMAQLDTPATEAAFSKEALIKGEQAATSVEKALGYKVHHQVRGAYADPSSELNDISSDMWVSSAVSVILILALLLFYMKRPANVLVVFVPLLCSMSWMMGTADLVYGRLTVLTSFVLALISGLGIEYSIHVYSRWMEARRDGHEIEEAMIVSLTHTGRSLISAMCASIVCMLALQVGHFQGFKEFGIVISIGIFLAFVASIFMLPPLLFALLRIGHFAEAHKIKFLEHLTPSEHTVEGAVLIPLWSWPRWVMRAGIVVSILITIAAVAAPHVGFENDFANLRSGKGKLYWLTSRIDKALNGPKKEDNSISYGRAVGKGKNSSYTVVMAPSEEVMREIHDTLGARFGEKSDTMLKSFATIQSFVPRKSEQLKRLEILKEIRATLDGPGFQGADSSDRAKLAMLRRYTVCDTFGFDSLPPYAQRFMTEMDGSHGKFGMIYADMKESDAVESKKFQDRYSHYSVKDSAQVEVASSGFLYADVVDMVKKDVGRLAVFVFLFLAAVIILDTRSWRGFVVNMGYMSLIATWTYGAMGWFGLKFGMFNIVVVPALLSNTVDATIHLYHRRMAMGRGHMGEILNTAGSSVLAGTLTNAFGFLSLVVVGHKGLNTIGTLSTFGFASSILLIFITMPWVLEVVCPKDPQGGEDEED